MATITSILKDKERGTLVEPVILVTHKSYPTFHSDEVAATALLCTIFSRKKIQYKMIKTFDPESLGFRDTTPSCVVYDIGMGLYDHHQSEGKDLHCLREDPDGVTRKYSSVGLIWKEISPFICPPDLADDIYDNFFRYIDDNDNGFDTNPLSYAIRSMNVSKTMFDRKYKSYPKSIEDLADERFYSAVKICKVFIEAIIARSMDSYRNRIQAERIVRNAKYRGYAVSDYYNDSVVKLCSKENVPFYIYPNIRNGNGEYCFQAITKDGGKINDHIINIPQNVRDWKGITFLHHSGFLGSAESKETAIETVKILINESEYLKIE